MFKTFKTLFIPFLLMGFTAWAAPETSSIRAQSRSAAQSCLAQVAVGTTRAVNYSWQALCNKNANGSSLFQADQTDYQLTRTEDGALVSAEIILDVAGREVQSKKGKISLAKLTDARKSEILKRTEECLPLFQQYWNRYDIKLDLKFKLKSGSDPVTTNTIQVTDGPGRSNSKHFYFAGLSGNNTLPGGMSIPAGPTALWQQLCRFMNRSDQECSESVREKEYCNMANHELGHRLGLPDEYADPACNAREFVSSEQYPFSVMATPQLGLLDTPSIDGIAGTDIDTGLAEFFPRHIKKVLAPLCPESTPE